MNSIRSMSRKINAMSVMIIALLILGLALAYNFYQARKLSVSGNQRLIADYLAYSLPSEAAKLIEKNLKKQPLSDKSIKMRRVLSEIYMNDLNDYEKALANLVFIKSLAPDYGVASGTEEAITYCLNRLGRVYDAERFNMLKNGENPLKNTIVSDTAVSFGNKHALSIADIKNTLEHSGNKELTKELVNGVVSGLTQKMLLLRAAKRDNIRCDAEFISRVKQFEEQLAMSMYIQKNVFKEPNLAEEKQHELFGKAVAKLAEQEDMKINTELIEKELLGAKNTDKQKNTVKGS